MFFLNLLGSMHLKIFFLKMDHFLINLIHNLLGQILYPYNLYYNQYMLLQSVSIEIHRLVQGLLLHDVQVHVSQEIHVSHFHPKCEYL